MERPKITPIQKEKESKTRDDEVTIKFFADNLNDFAGLGQLNLDAVVQQLVQFVPTNDYVRPFPQHSDKKILMLYKRDKYSLL